MKIINLHATKAKSTHGKHMLVFQFEGGDSLAHLNFDMASWCDDSLWLDITAQDGFCLSGEVARRVALALHESDIEVMPL
jgi:hypothetical protein